MSGPKVNSRRPTFAQVKAEALCQIDRVLSHWLPNGKRVDGGKEYTAPNPTRNDKHAGSLKISLTKGTWADFATGDKGGDLIDLVRYLESSSDVNACQKLVEFLRIDPCAAIPAQPVKKPATAEWQAVLPIPAEAMTKCPSKHRQHGTPSKVWCYRNGQGEPLMVLYRFDIAGSPEEPAKKVFAPLTWCMRGAQDTLALVSIS